MWPSDHQFCQTLQKSSLLDPDRVPPLHGKAAITLALATLLATACNTRDTAVAEPVALCGPSGSLATQLYGDYKTSLNWQPLDLECQGMPRPDSEGARLRFAGPARTGSAKRSLAFILAIPDLKKGETARELPTKVTFMEEGTGNFFSTQDTDNCWSDISVHERYTPDDKADDNASYTVSGITYCLAPLAELNGTGSVSFTDLTFTGLIDWRIPE